MSSEIFVTSAYWDRIKSISYSCVFSPRERKLLPMNISKFISTVKSRKKYVRETVEKHVKSRDITNLRDKKLEHVRIVISVQRSKNIKKLQRRAISYHKSFKSFFLTTHYVHMCPDILELVYAVREFSMKGRRSPP